MLFSVKTSSDIRSLSQKSRVSSNYAAQGKLSYMWVFHSESDFFFHVLDKIFPFRAPIRSLLCGANHITAKGFLNAKRILVRAIGTDRRGECGLSIVSDQIRGDMEHPRSVAGPF
ncbi:hypothetical protein NPIL_114951 [Nephila pilipes]|uniref:Uncharacterized protein n=1 Tax=Nephila pilipes TaxID=299642 RepID=A0A8X6QEC2_NEPPI|nr:hypothetical protein NPIL_114951 [Nephila pilipes]